MDDFKQRRPETKKLEDGFDVRPYVHIITQVVQFLMGKALHEMRRQDRHNPTMLGNVSFHIETNQISKETRLAFDKNPKTWNEKAIISDLLNMESDFMLDKQAHQDMLGNDNPFQF